MSDDKRAQPGAALQKVLRDRGAHISLEEARRLAETLIEFIADGIIVPSGGRPLRALGTNDLGVMSEAQPLPRTSG